MEKVNVFVSSTVGDLKKERLVIKKTLEATGLLKVFLSEKAGPQPKNSRQACLDAIAAADVFILIIGREYGYVPPADGTIGSPYNGSVSVTHGEFLKAQEFKKPILIFVKNATDRKPAERKFLKDLGHFLQGRFFGQFTESDKDLGERVLASMSSLLVELVRCKYTPPYCQKPQVIIVENPDEVAGICADILVCAIERRRYGNIGLSAGRTMGEVYDAFLSRTHDADFLEKIRTVNFFSVTEHFGIHPRNECSYRYWYDEALFNKLKTQWGCDISEENKKLVPSTIEKGTVKNFQRSYDQELQINKVEVQLISPAPNGQIISIDPGACDQNSMLSMGTSLVKYSTETSDYLVPRSPHDMDITIGMANLLGRSKRLVVPIKGEDKVLLVRRVLMGPMGTDCPASFLLAFKNINNLLFVIDRGSTSGLPDIKSGLEQLAHIISPDQWRLMWQSNESDGGD